MNTDDRFKNKSARYEKLPIPKKKTDKNSKSNAFKVKPGALSYQMYETVNKLAQPKCKGNPDIKNISNSSTVSKNYYTGNQRVTKLVNSNEHSKNSQNSTKGKISDTYACITAHNDKRGTRNLRQLAKSKKNLSEVHNVGYVGFGKDYSNTLKSYIPKTGVSPDKHKRK